MDLYRLFFSLFLLALRAHAFALPAPVVTNGSTAAIECKKHTVHNGDTCLGITRANNITYAQILAWNNNLRPACTNIQDILGKNIFISNPSGNFTIPNNSRGATTTISTQAPKSTPVLDRTNEHCGQFYKIAKGDDCSVIETQFGTSLKDFIFLNPEVDNNCTHLLLDNYYCVRPVGDISTYPGYGGAQTDDDMWVELPMKSVPRRDIMASYRTRKPTIPMANGTRRDCDLYFSLENDTTDCLGWAYQAETSLEEFMLWNPSLREDKKNINSSGSSNNPPPCTISASSSYCLMLTLPSPTPDPVQSPPSPRAIGEAANCNEWFLIGPQTTCDTIMGLDNLKKKDFCLMNPSVGKNCNGLVEGTYYCISTYPGGAQPYAKDDEDDDDNDDNKHTTTTDLAVTKSVPQKYTNDIATSTGLHTPTPTQSGMVDRCSGFYKVKKGDECSSIAAHAKIDVEDFYKWNPAVKVDCSGLQAEVYVCVERTGPGSTRSAMISELTTAAGPKVTTATVH